MKILKIFFIAGLIFGGTTLNLFGQLGAIKGNIIDGETKESIVGANVVVQGTVTGASTDFDGNYFIQNLKPGTYNLVVSYISYKTQTIEKVVVTKGKVTQLNISMESVSKQLGDVVITATRKTDTDIALLNSIKASNLVVNGMSNEQIMKTQDRDASEVIKRIPGITIIDNRFVMVRGLSERYNATWLNNAIAPSSEADVKAFSYDIIPSSLIDNILVFKTPAPELPAEFSGAAIQIFTKNIPEKNSITLGYATSYRMGTTANSFYRNNVGKTDWLGFDDGTRALPGGIPSHLNKLNDFNSATFSQDQIKLQEIGRSFNNNWNTDKTLAAPDQRLSLSVTKKFNIGIIPVNCISGINYSNTNTYFNLTRKNYQVYNFAEDKSIEDFAFNDKQYTNAVKASILSNWAFLLSPNHKLEFRNVFNQTGQSRTTLRNGIENYTSQILQSYEYRYLSRSTYSGQLGGMHSFKNDSMKLNWTLGYSFANRSEPDIRRLTSIKNQDPLSPYFGQYELGIGAAASPKYAGRIFLDLNEQIIMSSANFERKFKFNDWRPEFKTGYYIENKIRSFSARLLGYMKSSDQTNLNLYLPADSIFNASNINNSTGIKISESSNPSDSYDAGNFLGAGYMAFKIPITMSFYIYTGVRVEKNIQTLDSYKSDNPSEPVNYKNDEFNFFPSANLNYEFNEKNTLRAGYGQSINRPEFREIAPFVFYDFEQNAAYSGNPEIKNAIIHNLDLRYEYYPTKAEMFSLGVFYKQFINPIELKYINTGSGLQYTFQNAKEASSIGAEMELKKSLESFGKKDNFLKYLSNFNLVLNASVIKSNVKFEDADNEKDRPMQGQSPYIINAGIFYQNNKNGWMISMLYNVIGKRIVAVGQPMQNDDESIPDAYEMPRNLLDLTFSKKIGEKLQIKGGIQDILNNPYEIKQFVNFTQNGEKVIREQTTYLYKPGTYITLGLSYNF